MNKDNLTLSFFENIYYWLWHYIPKPGYTISPPAALACTFLSIFKILNLFWIFLLISAILKYNIIMTLFGTNIILILLISVVLSLFLIWYDEKKYEERIETICAKVEFLTRRERNIKKFIFFFYIIISLAVWGIADTLVAQYK